MRAATILAAVSVAACTAGDPPQSVEGAPSRVAAMQLNCGGQSFRVAFEDARAVVVGEDGQNTELPLLAPSDTSEPGVATYTNGMMSFAKQGGGDTPTMIRFARGRMAWQDCAIAQH